MAVRPDTPSSYHSPRSPSSAHRWRLCEAAIQECEGLPDTVGEEAHQGTVFHEYAAISVENGIEPWGMIGSRHVCDDGAVREFTPEMATKMLNGLDFINSVAAAPGAELYVEKRVSLDRWLGPEESGTSDTFIVDIMQRRLTTFDWKWGAGVPVSPDWNDQGILYTLGVWNDFAEAKFEAAGVAPEEVEVLIVIEQPRAPGGGGMWRTNMGVLLREGQSIKKDADATRKENPEYNPGEKQCQFCAAARLNKCKARNGFMMDLLGVDLEEDDIAARLEADDVIELANIRALDPERRSLILNNKKLITKWLEQLHDETIEDAKIGLPTPGLKRVYGRSPARKWLDEDKATFILTDRMGDEAYRTKLLTPAMVEEEVGKKLYFELYERHALKGDPKPILVPDSDPRDAIVSHNDLLDEAMADHKPEEPENLL